MSRTKCRVSSDFLPKAKLKPTYTPFEILIDFQQRICLCENMFTTKTFRLPLTMLASLSVIALSACASKNGTSRYGGEAIIDCVPPALPCGPAPIYRPMPMQAPPPIYVPPPIPAPAAVTVTTAPPKAAPLPAPPPAAPASPVYEPYVPNTYTPEPSTSEPYTSEPYTPSLPPLRSNRPVVDDPAEIPCPEGSIPSYGGVDCIAITVPRK